MHRHAEKRIEYELRTYAVIYPYILKKQASILSDWEEATDIQLFWVFKSSIDWVGVWVWQWVVFEYNQPLGTSLRVLGHETSYLASILIQGYEGEYDHREISNWSMIRVKYVLCIIDYAKCVLVNTQEPPHEPVPKSARCTE